MSVTEFKRKAANQNVSLEERLDLLEREVEALRSSGEIDWRDIWTTVILVTVASFVLFVLPVTIYLIVALIWRAL